MLAVDRDKVWTYEEYRRLPDDGKRYEIIDGTLYVTSAPRTLHQALSGNLHVLLYQLQLAGQGWVLTARVDVLMPGASPVLPDLVFVAMEQRSILTPDGVDGVLVPPADAQRLAEELQRAHHEPEPVLGQPLQ